MVRKRILITAKTHKELQQAFGCVPETVSRAINYRINSDLAKKIRSLAIQKGGIVAGGDERSMRQVGNYWAQSFGEHVEIAIYNDGKELALFKDGEELQRVMNATSLDLLKMQERATLLSGTL